MIFANQTDKCDDGKHRARDIDRISGITLHHFGVELATDAECIAEWYRDNPSWTGGQMPYTFVIKPTGVCEQALALREIGPHARRWSSPTVSVVYLGTFDDCAPPQVQWDAGAELVSELCLALRIDPLGRDDDDINLVEGHTARPSATSYPGKSCPGVGFNMFQFRADVVRLMREGAIQRLANLGVIS